ncbi:MAG: monofunctional biosynthetic peptidoglycan transglycosylase, partial [Gallionella sp.]|nr:monofunctional biosynthetic peptidoglycan transglycosylase [Gallionella sp.]
MKKLWSWLWRGTLYGLALILLYQVWLFAHVC